MTTTTQLVKAFVVHGDFSKPDAKSLLDGIAECRSWEGNAYVHKASQLFE